MPRAELPSGNWVEYRDALMVQDRFAVNAAITYSFEPREDGGETRTVSAAVDDRMRAALLGRIITAWSFPGIPVPAQNTAEAGELIGSVLTLDDYEALTEATQGLFQQVIRTPKARTGQSAT